VLLLHLLPDCLVVEGSTAVPICDPKAAANVATENIFDCTRCPGLKFASPGMLPLNFVDPRLHEDLEVTIDELMKTQFDNLHILYVPAAW
jgi:hypothetical protein